MQQMGFTFVGRDPVARGQNQNFGAIEPLKAIKVSCCVLKSQDHKAVVIFLSKLRCNVPAGKRLFANSKYSVPDH